MKKQYAGRLKIMYEVEVYRNGKRIYHQKPKRDLQVWRGQSVIAGLLSQGAVGTDTATWYIVLSSNSTMPNMNDDSGDPEANEFSPTIGTKVSASYEFTPTDKTNSGYQVLAQLKIYGQINITGNATLRKIGIIDNVATPNRNIVVEDAVIPVDLHNGDTVKTNYFIYMF